MAEVVAQEMIVNLSEVTAYTLTDNRQIYGIMYYYVM